MPDTTPYLVRKDGPLAGTLYELREPVTSIGRAPENDIAIVGADALVVSGRHAELRLEDGRWQIRDLESTNGTFVNGERVSEAALEPPATLQLGKGGPELYFTNNPQPLAAPGLDRTLVADPTVLAGGPAGAPLTSEHDRLLREAIARARQVRQAGVLNQTGAIMREAMASAIHRSRRRLKWAIAALAVVLAAVSATAGVRIWQLSRAKHDIDAQIDTLERQLAATETSREQADRLALELDRYQSQGRELARSPFYRLGVRQNEDFLTREIATLLAEFGAEVYSIPPEFRTAVQRYLRQYQGPDRPHMARALNEARPAMDTVRRVLSANTLPPDFAYMTLVESALDTEQKSRAGCAGLWQFTPATARAFGLRVDAHVDERLSVTKSTQAACKYIRDLILDFGAGSSVMLALAAYNLGPSKVKQAIRKVDDPIKQRNFWYLYRVRALPVETREYVPKVIAAMIVGRQPARYGF
ncbi:MAG TPA: transglycosylase SLT domain-containing protein [Bryobacteraceae bacterium]|nr:transglycosylase SLT domain-containing protein [Bryobacteraceae bacterium]